MASVNKVIILGRLGRDPELRETSGGTTVCRLAVATSRRYTKDGQKQEATEWHDISLFGKTAEIAGQYLKKGSEVYVEGRLHTRKYTGKDGVERYATEIQGDQMQLGARPTGEQQSPAALSQQTPASKNNRPEDDIPF